MGLPLVYRRNPLIFPGRQPGFDPSHPAAAGMAGGQSLSLIPSGASFIDLLSGKACSVNGSPTPGSYGGMGPTVYSASSSNNCSITLVASPTTSRTVAGICSVVSFAAGTNFNNIFGYSNYAFGFDESGLVGAYLNGFTGAALQATINTPYFVAYSFNSGVLNAVLSNLATGQVSAAVGSGGSIASGTAYEILAQGSFALNGYLAAVMQSPTFLSIPQLRAWAQRPWDFWYPPTVENLIFSSLTASAPAPAPPINQPSQFSTVMPGVIKHVRTVGAW